MANKATTNKVDNINKPFMDLEGPEETIMNTHDVEVGGC